MLSGSQPIAVLPVVHICAVLLKMVAAFLGQINLP